MSTAEPATPETEEESSSIIPVKFYADMRLDTATVRNKIARYPEEVIEPIVWLATYMHEQCGGQRRVLAKRIEDLSIDGAPQELESYLYQVLTGRYFKPDPKRPGKYLGSISNTLKIVTALRAGVLLNERAGKLPFIVTETSETIRNYIDEKRTPGSVCRFGAIFGPTGRQKTESEKHYCHVVNNDPNKKDGSRCVHVEVEDSSLAAFLSKLTFKFGNGRGRYTAVKKVDITRCVTDETTIMIDNVQRLYRPGRGGDQPIFNFIQTLQDDTGCTIFLTFASIHSDFLISGLEQGYFEQFEGRCGGRENFLEIEDYSTDGDLTAFAAGAGMVGSDEEINYLRELSRKPGRDRVLLDSIQKAMRALNGVKRPLTIHDLKAARGEA